jgi:uncharacterized membrane protein
MRSNDTRIFIKAVGMGIIAGMRSLAAPALVSNHLAHNPPEGIARTPLRVLAYPKTAAVLKALALGEMIADKLPMIPARVSPAPLIARATSGAICGASLFAAEDKQPALGGLAGALAAIASAYAFYHLRRSIGQQSGAPDFALGLAEDATAVCIGLNILSGGESA